MFTYGKNCLTTYFSSIPIVKGHTTLLHVVSFTVELIMRLPSSALGLCLTWGALRVQTAFKAAAGFTLLTCLSICCMCGTCGMFIKSLNGYLISRVSFCISAYSAILSVATVRKDLSLWPGELQPFPGIVFLSFASNQISPINS